MPRFYFSFLFCFGCNFASFPPIFRDPKRPQSIQISSNLIFNFPQEDEIKVYSNRFCPEGKTEQFWRWLMSAFWGIFREFCSAEITSFFERKFVGIAELFSKPPKFLDWKKGARNSKKKHHFRTLPWKTPKSRWKIIVFNLAEISL